MERLGFSGYQGNAIKLLQNNRYLILIDRGHRTAKLTAIKDFQWNDKRFNDEQKSLQIYEDEKDNMMDPYQKDLSLGRYHIYPQNH